MVLVALKYNTLWKDWYRRYARHFHCLLFGHSKDTRPKQEINDRQKQGTEKSLVKYQ